MSYNQRGGLRNLRSSYGSGSNQGGYRNQNQPFNQPGYSSPGNYGNKNDLRPFQQNYSPSQKPHHQQLYQQQSPSQQKQEQKLLPHQQQQDQQPKEQHQQTSQQQPSPVVQQSQQQVSVQFTPTPTPVPAPVPPPKLEPLSQIPVEQSTPAEQNPTVKVDDENKNETPMDVGDDNIVNIGVVNTPNKSAKFRPWNKRGASNIKITRKMRKRRQNARLRNLLAPKNAMMVLHELHPELKMIVSEQINAANQTAYTVEIEVESKIYKGHGMSKMAAKQAASENALKAVLLEKLEQNNLKINPDNTISSESLAHESGLSGEGDVEMKDETSQDDTNFKASPQSTTPVLEAVTVSTSESLPVPPQFKITGRRLVEDDVPWGSLASFALFKLFSEWQSQGFQLPPSGLPPVFNKSSNAKKIPDDANQKHPVQLLNQIRPGSQYSESREGNPPNLSFKFTVVVDGQTFTGVGSNKKDAKKDCAKRALEALGVKYEA